jgi:hypothetical protein
MYIQSRLQLSSFHLLGLGIARKIRQLPRCRGIRVEAIEEGTLAAIAL